MKAVEETKKAAQERVADVAKAVAERGKSTDASVDRLALASQRRAIAYGRARGCP